MVNDHDQMVNDQMVNAHDSQTQTTIIIHDRRLDQ